MDPSRATPPLWAGRIGPLIRCLTDAEPAARQRHRSELWAILHAALFAALRAQAGRIGPVSQEDLEDLASGKALELLQQAEGRSWEPAGRGPDETAGFVWRVARNALVDLARRRGREAPPPSDAEGWDHALAPRAEREAGPVELTVAGEFVEGLAGCLERLNPRSRAAWYRRAVLERPTRETADALGLKPAHVDVLVQRARESLARCMSERGHAAHDVHPQAFVLLWSRFARSSFFDPPAASGMPVPRAAGPAAATEGVHG